jgi:hypothetical protein
MLNQQSSWQVFALRSQLARLLAGTNVTLVAA